jgi:AraC-like DNA-binding protein
LRFKLFQAPLMRIDTRLHLEKIPATAGQLFGLRRSRSSFFPFLWHYHPELELTLIRRGRGLRYVGHSIEAYEEGDLCLLGGSLPHSWSSERKSGRVESTVIQFLPESGGEAFWKLRELRELTRFLREAKGGWSIGGTLRRRAVERIDELEKLPVGSPLRVSLFIELLAGLISKRGLRPLHPGAPPPVGPRPGRSEAILQAILRQVEANSARELVHREVARLVGFSPPAFCRFFKRQMGKTFSDHVNDVRLARACVELADTDRGITEIAFGCGYNNLAHFNRRFRLTMACTPRDYRRRMARAGTLPVK